MLGIFHYTPEGSYLSTGLNVYWTKSAKGWWFRIIWCWANPQGDCISYYFRFRSKLTPHFIFRKHEWNCISNWLELSSYTLISNENYSDACSIIKSYFTKKYGRNASAEEAKKETKEYIDTYFPTLKLERKTVIGPYGPYKIFETIPIKGR